MAVIDPTKRDLAKDPAKPGDWIKTTIHGRPGLRKMLHPGQPTSWEAVPVSTSSAARVSR